MTPIARWSVLPDGTLYPTSNGPYVLSEDVDALLRRIEDVEHERDHAKRLWIRDADGQIITQGAANALVAEHDKWRARAKAAEGRIADLVALITRVASAVAEDRGPPPEKVRINLNQLAQNPDGQYKITCCACGCEIADGEHAAPDESGWLCEKCADGEPRYGASTCVCGNCGATFEKAWQVPPNAVDVAPPNKLTCPKCGQRAAVPVLPVQYCAGMFIEGDEE